MRFDADAKNAVTCTCFSYASTAQNRSSTKSHLMKSLKRILLSALFFSSILAGSVYAGERWYVSATANGMAGNYSDSELRDNFYSASAWLNVDYLDYYSVALAYNNLRINFKDADAGEFDISQDAFAGRFQYYFYNDTLAGKITTQLVAHSITNDARAAVAADEIIIIAPKLSYMSYEKDLAMGLEYAWSDYSNNSSFIIQQLTPSIGFGFNRNNDWIQLKAYLITSSDKNLSQNEDSFTSASIKWQHWFNPGPVFGAHNFFIDVLAGERVFAVDNDTFSVYNLEDIQQGSVLLGLGWRPGEDFDITAIAGVEKYKNKIIDNTYNREYLYISLSKHW